MQSASRERREADFSIHFIFKLFTGKLALSS